MDDIYDDLENFNEENRIAELQNENTDLKSKLEEYASTLDTLQKDFDKLSSEYKILEGNYSSLLKTAKAEIERKTQLIKTLNFEKDKMVIESYQNKNVVPLHRSRPYEKQISPQNSDIKFEKYNNVKETESNRKLSPQSRIERKEHHISSNDTRPSSNPDINNKLPNMANNNIRPLDPRIGSNSYVKENIVQPIKENDSYKPRASIKNRRKSMPAVSMGMAKFSSDDEDMVVFGSHKDLSRGNSNRRHLDNINEKQCSRRSETSSLEERTSGHHDPVSSAHKHRYSRYDNDKTDKCRKRNKSSHRYKIPSPDRYRREPMDYPDVLFRRSDNERRRVVESPPRDKYYLRQSRDPQRNIYERSHPHDHDRLQQRSQEKYSTKHKIQHSYDESNSKRMKIDPPRQQEVEQRLHDEREHLEKKYGEPFQFTSCESPDYNHPDIHSTHQIREIKLTATTKIDDPRMSNKKYKVKKYGGKVALSTAEGRNVDIVPVNKTAWGIKPVNMPEALMRRPSQETIEAVKETGLDIDDPVNISIESVKPNQKSLNFQTGPNNEVKENVVSKTDGKQIPVINVVELKNTENSLQKVSYKIPKLKKTVDDKSSRKENKNIPLSVKPEHESTPKNKSINTESTSKSIDNSKATMNSVIEKPYSKTEKTGSSMIHYSNTLPCLGISDKLKYESAKAVVEGDLELSDDTCDYNEQPNIVTKEHVKKQTHQNKKGKDKKYSEDTVNDTTEASKTYTNDVKSDKNDVTMKTKLEKVVVTLNKDKTPDESKKSKNKKKLKRKESKEEFQNRATAEIPEKKTKHKETKEELESKDTTGIREKPTRKGKDIETKTKQIKPKFSELFDDSSSLISPEDLGLTALPAHNITPLSDKCVPFFEDAQDAIDLNAIKATQDLALLEKPNEEANKQNSNTTMIDTANSDNQESVDVQLALTKQDLALLEKPNEEANKQSSNTSNTKIIDTANTDNQESVVVQLALKDLALLEKPNEETNKQSSNTSNTTIIDTSNIDNQESVVVQLALTNVAQIAPSKVMQPAIDKDLFVNMYRNLEPEVPEKEKDVKTVIISTGVQPQISIEDEIQKLTCKTEPHIRTASQEIALKALATSTPYKILQSNLVKPDAEINLPDKSSNSNESRVDTGNKTGALDNSDNNTLDSQTDDTVPDVRIFVRRRRKVIRK